MNMTESQLQSLRSEFAAVTTIDVTSPAYRRLVTLLDRLPEATIRALAAAKIPFVSRMASNRLPR